MKKKYFFKLIVVMILFSCSKEKIVQLQNNPTPTMPSPLAGQEFLFENLTWQFYGQPGSGFDETYVQTVAKPDLFSNMNGPINAIISIKVDTSNTWIEVKHSQHYDFRAPLQYLYDIYSSKLIVSVFPTDQNLTGKKATIKTKFF
jgi:hypothetical protein